MRTLVLTTSVLALAVLFTSFVRAPVTPDAATTASISTIDLTRAAGPLAVADYVEAH